MDGVAWIRFKDNAFLALCLPLWDTDGDGGITVEEANVPVFSSSVESPFAFNSDIVDATDFKYLNWTRLGKTDYRLFHGCPNLKRAAIRDNTPLGSEVFRGCTSLEYVELQTNVSNPESDQSDVFRDCTSLKNITLPINKTIYGRGYFQDSGIERLILPNVVTSIGAYFCFDCAELLEVRLGSNITSIANQCWNGCEKVNWFSIAAETPPVLADQNSFVNTTFPIYVPRGSGAAYKAATNWNVWASRIVEYDF